MNGKVIGKAKVVSATEYTRKKDGEIRWLVTLITEDGVMRAFRPYEEKPQQGQEYALVLRYDAFNYEYKVVVDVVK